MNVANSDQHPQVELRKKAKWTSDPAEGSRGPALGFLGGSLLRLTTPLCLIRIGFPSTQVWKHTKDEVGGKGPELCKQPRKSSQM